MITTEVLDLLTMNDVHFKQLDGIRFYAVLMVMIGHWLQWRWSDGFLTKVPFVHGVVLFFVLSGFLITRILLNNREYMIMTGLSKWRVIRTFYLRRAFRIFPVYYLLILGLLLFNFDRTAELFPWLATFTINIYQSLTNEYVSYFSHFWSLAVEEQFYLFWPFVILFIKPHGTLRVVFIVIAISLISKYCFFAFYNHWMATAYFTLCSMSALGIGGLLAYIIKYLPQTAEKLSRPLFPYLAFGCYCLFRVIALQSGFPLLKEVFDDLVFAIFAFFFILRAVNGGFTGLAKLLLENKFVNFSGKISYGLYVFHLFIPPLFYFLFDSTVLKTNLPSVDFICFFTLTYIVAVISWFLIERPINRLKEKWVKDLRPSKVM